MDGIADMGGMHGFGPIDRSDDDGPFHDEWERRILGITFAALGAGLFNVDEIRRVTESIDPLIYLKSSYYERWLYSTEDLLREKGVVTAGELATGRSVMPAVSTASPVTREMRALSSSRVALRAVPTARHRVSNRMTLLSLAISIRSDTRGYHATFAASAAPSSWIMAFSLYRTATPPV